MYVKNSKHQGRFIGPDPIAETAYFPTRRAALIRPGHPIARLSPDNLIALLLFLLRFAVSKVCRLRFFNFLVQTLTALALDPLLAVGSDHPIAQKLLPFLGMDFDPNRLGRQGDQISFRRGLLIFFDVSVAVDQISFAGADLSVISGQSFLDDMFGDNFGFGVFLEPISDVRS